MNGFAPEGGERRVAPATPPATTLPPMAEGSPPVPRVVGGRHRIEQRVGQGSLGSLHRAHDEVEDAPVALELARDAVLALDDLPERLGRAVEEARTVRHATLVRIVDAGDEDGRPFVAWSWVEGRALRHRLTAGPLDPEQALGVLDQLAGALDAVHAAGLVHLDVGTSSVLVRDTPAGLRAQLTGLGVSRALLEAGAGPALTLGTTAAGLPAALAPELATGAAPDARSDVYALAALAFELLSGTPPFSGSTPAAVLAAHAVHPRPRLSSRRPTLPGALDPVLEAGMALEPAERPASAGVLVVALREALDRPAGAIDADTTLAPGGAARRLAPSAGASGRTSRAGGYARHHRRAVTAAVLILVMSGGAVTGAALAAFDDEPATIVDVPVLPAPARLQEKTDLPLRPAPAPGPDARVAVVDTLREFPASNAGSGETGWKAILSAQLVVEARGPGGRCTRTATPKPRTASDRTPGAAWLRQRRATRELPWALEGLRPSGVTFSGPRLASWRGTYVAATGGRGRLRVWLARDGMAASWRILLLDFCPDTPAET